MKTQPLDLSSIRRAALVCAAFVALVVTGCAADYQRYAGAVTDAAKATEATKTARFTAMQSLGCSTTFILDGSGTKVTKQEVKCDAETQRFAAFALAVAGMQGKDESGPKIEAPYTIGNAIRDIGGLVVPLANVGAQIYGIKQNAATAIAQSNNATALGVSTNNTFAGIAGAGYSAVTGVANSGFTAVTNVANTGFATVGSVATAGFASNSSIATAGFASNSSIATAGFVANQATAQSGIAAAVVLGSRTTNVTNVTGNGNAVNGSTADNSTTTTTTTSTNNCPSGAGGTGSSGSTGSTSQPNTSASTGGGTTASATGTTGAQSGSTNCTAGK